MDTNTLTMWVVVANSVAWMAFAVLVLFEMNRMTLRLQVVEPVRSRRIKRFTGIQKGLVWHTIRNDYYDGYDKVIVWEETMGVGIETVVLEKIVK